MKQMTLLAVIAIWLTGCIEDSFVSDSLYESDPQAPSGLSYAPMVNAREYSVMLSAPPTYNSYGAIPTFEILKVKDGDGAVVPEDTVSKYFTILNYSVDTVVVDDDGYFVNEAGDTIRQYTAINSQDIGRIQIASNNPLKEGTYFFDIKMTTTYNDQVFATTFENVFELYMGPRLASGLVYVPGGQNLLVGQDDKTTAPMLFGANPDYRFELGDHTDKLRIDAATGELSMVSGYVPTEEPEIVSPTINVISNITDELVSFQDVINVYLSSEPVDIPKLTVDVFYPTMEAENTVYGYRIHTVLEGDPDIFWNNSNADAIAGEYRPDENSNQRKLVINLVKPSTAAQVPHESWCIMNSQDLSAYQFGYDVEATFYTKNRFVEYLSTDGTSPSLFKMYISSNYTGDFEAAEWTEITDELVSNIESGGAFVEENEFEGFPYPGDQGAYGFDDPDGLKDASKNGDNKYTRSVFDLSPYAGMSNVTIAFRVHTTFEGTIARAGNSNRSGQYWLSDFHIKAYEQ
ncbi:hypothetical protein [Marinoscillum furvescens]|uniref:Uncharacterized protein n=1 Tax=Marinoscillum furvescens DSM 4134 TaxID=1122208 RepID=A0A3D9L628_MARFU|nr:hypothetical protein [Marinoscillum furvescens]REE01146.1 hypothetical protein C7460_104166 [Marinoscillum furvescens DSM 4134]